MKNILKFCITPDSTIENAILKINETGLQIALIINNKNKLLGVLTDGDIRRIILKDQAMNLKVKNVMNKSPIVVLENTSKEQMFELMKSNVIHQLPVIDNQKRLVNLITLDDIIEPPKKKNKVIIMAGGLGTRLQHLTKKVPKPMLKLGKKPIIEIILENFIKQGFNDFYFSVNYKSKVIMDYFKNGSDWGVSIKYLIEEKQLGTVGALSLIKEKISEPLVVINGDVIIKTDFDKLLNFHHQENSDATMVVKQKEFEIPYGVVKSEGYNFISISEKPIDKIFINSGVYILNSSCLKYIPKNKFYDMPSLFQKIKEKNKNIKIFPTSEYWIDIGEIESFKKAKLEWK